MILVVVVDVVDAAAVLYTCFGMLITGYGSLRGKVDLFSHGFFIEEFDFTFQQFYQ